MKIRAFGLITLFTVYLLGCSMMRAQTLSANKAVVLRSEAELWSKGNLAVADELYSPDFICHFVGGIEWTGLNGIKSAVLSHRTSFPDWHEKVEDIIAEGDRVVIRITSTGTQLGEFAGIAPTGKEDHYRRISYFSFGRRKDRRAVGDAGCSRLDGHS